MRSRRPWTTLSSPARNNESYLSSAIDGDLLKLVHLSNGFKIIPGSRPLKAGDVWHAGARVVAVVNGDSGKTVRVSGRVLASEGNPVTEIQSAFFFRGRFTDYESTFEAIGYKTSCFSQSRTLHKVV